MKTTTIIALICTTLSLQFSLMAQTQNPAPSPTNALTTATTAVNPNHLITVTADYNANAISLFYPDRTELIYVKIRKSRWVNNNKYAALTYDVFYQDGTRKHFENVQLFRKQDILQRVLTDHLSKLRELGYKLVNTNITDFNGEKFLTAFLEFEK